MDTNPNAQKPTLGFPMIMAGTATLGLAAYLFAAPITPTQPPSIYAPLAGLISLCLGVAGAFAIRHHRRIAAFNTLALICILSGLAGMIYFGRQSFRWRELVETNEKTNVQAIVTAAQTWSHQHAARWPDSLDQLLTSHLLDPNTLTSPISAESQIQSTTRPGTVVFDYTYVGQGLTSPVTSPDKILAAYSLSPRLGDDYICCFADGHTAWIKEVQAPGDTADDMSQIITKSNTARRDSGYPPVAITVGNITVIDEPTSAPARK